VRPVELTVTPAVMSQAADDRYLIIEEFSITLGG
jgi:hypothetical protein